MSSLSGIIPPGYLFREWGRLAARGMQGNIALYLKAKDVVKE
jgi:hypothetical protein